ncbi:phage tail assembly chaperone G [Gracilibacillus dipsosauri]|uniref:phage tail assembly chaperone G n=1 Tax=Gracilibacillus dipsosauri TaxID=178340 RepID=UPI002409776C
MSLKREKIELIKNPEAVNKGDEPEIEKIWTIPFISFGTSREAVGLLNEIAGNTELSDDDKNDKVIDFLTEKAFGGKITKDDIYNRIPGPGFSNQGNAQEVLEGILFFVASGQQTDDTKNFLAEKK